MSQAPQESPIRSRKEAILDVATRLFAEHGYEGTSMNDVAERAGIRKASLFYHYASKDALYEAVLDALIAHIAGPLQEILARDGSFEERLDASADMVATVFGTNPFAARLVVREFMDWGPALQGKLLETVLAVLEFSTAFFRAGQEAGVFIEGDPKQFILTALGAELFPYALSQLTERYIGLGPFDPRFIQQRRDALRTHFRRMWLRGPTS